MREFIQTKHVPPDQIADRTREVYDTVLRESRYLDAGNFTSVHPDDLELLFELYDRLFFEGGCRELLGDQLLYFRLSNRMTQRAGMARRREEFEPDGKLLATEYDIAVSTTLLYQTFRDEERPIVMSGIPCRDRLEAMQRVFEHELIHLIEMLIWIDSSCSAPRFQSIANRFFGHTEHTHQLITPRERALTKFGIRRGDRVSFRFEGQHYTGVVNRITKRATVLVEDRSGSRYSDGRRYKKFYVPLEMLESSEPSGK